MGKSFKPLSIKSDYQRSDDSEYKPKKREMYINKVVQPIIDNNSIVPKPKKYKYGSTFYKTYTKYTPPSIPKYKYKYSSKPPSIPPPPPSKPVMMKPFTDKPFINSYKGYGYVSQSSPAPAPSPSDLMNSLMNTSLLNPYQNLETKGTLKNVTYFNFEDEDEFYDIDSPNDSPNYSPKENKE